MDTKKAKEFIEFLKCGWWVVAWLLFLAYTFFWSMLLLGIFGSVALFHQDSCPILWVIFALAFLSSVGTSYFFFNLLNEDEDKN